MIPVRAVLMATLPSETFSRGGVFNLKLRITSYICQVRRTTRVSGSVTGSPTATLHSTNGTAAKQAKYAVAYPVSKRATHLSLQHPFKINLKDIITCSAYSDS